MDNARFETLMHQHRVSFQFMMVLTVIALLAVAGGMVAWLSSRALFIALEGIGVASVLGAARMHTLWRRADMNLQSELRASADGLLSTLNTN